MSPGDRLSLRMMLVRSASSSQQIRVGLVSFDSAFVCRGAAQAGSSVDTCWGSGVNESNTVCRNMYTGLKLTVLTAKYA